MRRATVNAVKSSGRMVGDSTKRTVKLSREATAGIAAKTKSTVTHFQQELTKRLNSVATRFKNKATSNN
ncbi:MAG: hypothetical protein Q8S19_04160 [Bacillota bacterium]|nr:hypothetical protein [Bacillota bacterium]